MFYLMGMIDSIKESAIYSEVSGNFLLNKYLPNLFVKENVDLQKHLA